MSGKRTALPGSHILVILGELGKAPPNSIDNFLGGMGSALAGLPIEEVQVCVERTPPMFQRQFRVRSGSPKLTPAHLSEWASNGCQAVILIGDFPDQHLSSRNKVTQVPTRIQFTGYGTGVLNSLFQEGVKTRNPSELQPIIEKKIPVVSA